MKLGFAPSFFFLSLLSNAPIRQCNSSFTCDRVAFCHDSCSAVDELAIWRCGEEGNLFLYGSLRAARVCLLLWQDLIAWAASEEPHISSAFPLRRGWTRLDWVDGRFGARMTLSMRLFDVAV